MSSTTSSASPRGDTFWWQGGLMEIKTRAEDTGGALGVLEGRFPYEGYGTPLHVHSREDEAMYVLEGQIRFRVGDDELVAGPGSWVWQPRGIPQAFRVESERARALVIFTPGGLERMWEDGGVPAGESAEPPPQPQPDPETGLAPQSGTASRSSDRSWGNRSPYRPTSTGDRDAARGAHPGGRRVVHLDIMDGRFAGPLNGGAGLVGALPGELAADVHLMVEDPERHVEPFIAAGAEAITFHPEATPHPHRLLRRLGREHVLRGVALSPSTSLTTLEPLLGDVELVLVLAVNPGVTGGSAARTVRAARAPGP